jgi:aminopeptidase 2
MLGTMVSICTSSFTSKEGVDRVQKFFADRSTKGFDQSLAQSCDAIRAKAAWLERDREDVKQWTEKYTVKNIKVRLHSTAFVGQTDISEVVTHFERGKC